LVHQGGIDVARPIRNYYLNIATNIDEQFVAARHFLGEIQVEMLGKSPAIVLTDRTIYQHP